MGMEIIPNKEKIPEREETSGACRTITFRGRLIKKTIIPDSEILETIFISGSATFQCNLQVSRLSIVPKGWHEEKSMFTPKLPNSIVVLKVVR